MHSCSLVIDGSCLPNFNNDIDNILDLSALYRCLQENVIPQSSLLQHSNMFTVQLFAPYLVFLAHGDSITDNGKLQNVLVQQYTFDMLNMPTCYRLISCYFMSLSGTCKGRIETQVVLKRLPHFPYLASLNYAGNSPQYQSNN